MSLALVMTRRGPATAARAASFLHDQDPEQTPGFSPLIHINADGGDGGNLATASTVLRAT
jgi:hypothetical protein